MPNLAKVENQLVHMDDGYSFHLIPNKNLSDSLMSCDHFIVNQKHDPNGLLDPLIDITIPRSYTGRSLSDTELDLLALAGFKSVHCCVSPANPYDLNNYTINLVDRITFREKM